MLALLIKHELISILLSAEKSSLKGRTGRHRTECKVAVCPSLAGVALATTALPPVSNRGAQIRLETVIEILKTLISQGFESL